MWFVNVCLCKEAHISGVLDLFFPLKNSGSALLSISWMLEQRGKLQLSDFIKNISTYSFLRSLGTLLKM